VIDEASAMGVRDIQLIGGEATLHPELPKLICHAHARGLTVEVYTNLVRVPVTLWGMFEQPRVRLATSYYSADAAEHDAITGQRSHDRTLGSIAEALRRNVPLRVGIIRLNDHQDVEAAEAELRAMGVSRVEVDDMRQIGRGVRDKAQDASQLCGRCNHGKLAVLPSGDVVPCTLSRWVILGNVRKQPLPTIYARSVERRESLMTE
jgi:MoaA/NifB/PqqE/SkfB family radical SAM enzyme